MTDGDWIYVRTLLMQGKKRYSDSVLSFIVVGAIDKL